MFEDANILEIILFLIIVIQNNIIKLFQYAWIVIIPIILIIIFLLTKKKKIDQNNIKQLKIISNIIKCLIIFIIVSVFTVRGWGPNFYKKIISFSICNKEKIVERKLEEKYKKNFNYISQSEIIIEDGAGSSLELDITIDYSVRYIFKDDEGVIAIVDYQKGYKKDYYESKRSKYEVENLIYDYAKKVNFDKTFYVYLESSYELSNCSELNEKSINDFIKADSYHDGIQFILTESSEENQDFIVSAIKAILDRTEYDDYLDVNEHIVTEEEYRRAVNFYNSRFLQNGIAGTDYNDNFDFNENNQIELKRYYVR